jgi:DNA replication protein DnaC
LNISTLKHTFEAYIPETKESELAKKTLMEIVSGKLNKKFILLWGTTGCGKTHLIEALIINWAKKGMPTRYMTFSDIARRLKMAIGKGGDTYEGLFNAIMEMKRLVVDDYGMGTMETKYEVSELEDIIDLRYRKRYYPDNDMVTVLATNKDIKELPDRISSRFYDPEFGVVLYMGNKDYRRRVNDRKVPNK